MYGHVEITLHLHMRFRDIIGLTHPLVVQECELLMNKFITESPELWNENIGQEN